MTADICEGHSTPARRVSSGCECSWRLPWRGLLLLLPGIDGLNAVTLVLEGRIVELLPAVALALVFTGRWRCRGRELDGRDEPRPARILAEGAHTTGSAVGVEARETRVPEHRVAVDIGACARR